MVTSAQEYPSGQSAQQRAGRFADDRLDRLADDGTGLDSLADMLKRAISPIVGDTAPQSLRDALNGAWLGHPLHPVIVTLPLGAWTLTTLFDLLGEERAADLCLVAGLGAAGAAALSGAAQWNDVTDQTRPRRIGAVHSLLNTVATGVYGVSWYLRHQGYREAGVAVAGAGLTLVSLSGWLGGHLAYSLGVGVDTAATAIVPGDASPGPDISTQEASDIAR